jgi:hypothetical protein
VQIAGRPPHSPDDARYFVAWIDRVSETTSLYPDWNSESEKRAVLGRLAEARAKFVALQ